jgi:hypothetical protein
MPIFLEDRPAGGWWRFVLQIVGVVVSYLVFSCARR